MQSVARKITRDEPSLESGTIVDRSGRELRVRADGADFSAARAKSCLVDPEVGDAVLVARTAAGSWVLAVLEGAREATSLVAEGDLEIRSRAGRIRIGSDVGVEMTSPAEVSVVAARFGLHAVDASAVFERMTLIGAKLRADVGAVKTIAGAIDSVVERVTQRAKRVYRYVEEFDQLRSAHIDYAAKGIACVRGENTVMTAGECVKIDGEQVHIG